MAAQVRGFAGDRRLISPNPRRLILPAFDPATYKARNLIERAFCRLKDWRAIATRYDETARNFLTGIYLAIAAWIGCNESTPLAYLRRQPIQAFGTTSMRHARKLCESAPGTSGGSVGKNPTTSV